MKSHKDKTFEYMNDTNDTIFPLNKTENASLVYFEENFNDTYFGKFNTLETIFYRIL